MRHRRLRRRSQSAPPKAWGRGAGVAVRVKRTGRLGLGRYARRRETVCPCPRDGLCVLVTNAGARKDEELCGVPSGPRAEVQIGRVREPLARA